MAVEVLGARSYNSRVFDHQDGAFTLEAHAGHIHFKQKGSGLFLPISWDLSWDGGLRRWGFGSHSFEPALPEFADGWAYFRDLFHSKDQTIGFRAVASHVQGVLVPDVFAGANAVVYADAFGAGRDLIYGFSRSTFRKLIRFRAGYYPASDVNIDFEISVPSGLRAYRGVVKDLLTEVNLTKTTVIPLTEQLLIGLEQATGEEWFTYIRDARVWDSAGNRARVQLSIVRSGNKVYLRKTVPASFFLSAVGDVFTDDAASYYSGAGDGEVSNWNGPSGTWAACRSASAGQELDTTSAYARANVYEADWDTDLFGIHRYFLPVDTSGLPDAATISAASLYMYYDGVKTNGDNDTYDFVGVVQASQASPTTLALGDFDQVGTTEAHDSGARIDLGTFSSNGYYSWAFNATGRGFISKTGYTLLALREGHDLLDHAIATNLENMIRLYASEQSGTANDPYLAVTYSTATTHELGLQANSASAVNITLVSSKRLGSSASSSSGATLSPRVEKRISSSSSSQAVSSAALRIDRLIAAVSSSDFASSLSLKVEKAPAMTASSASTAALSLVAEKVLSLQVQETSGASLDLLVGSALSALVSSASAVSLGLEVSKTLLLTVDDSSSALLALQVERRIAIQIASEGAVSLAISIAPTGQALGVTCEDQGGASASLEVGKYLGGTVAADSVASISLAAERRLGLVASAVTGASAAIETATGLSGSASSSTGAYLGLEVEKPLSSLSAAALSVLVALAAQRRLAASSAAAASCSLSLEVGVVRHQAGESMSASSRMREVQDRMGSGSGMRGVR